jgi:hypothetical protein
MDVAPAVTIGGYGRGLGIAEVREAGNAHHSPDHNVGDREAAVDFAGEGQLWVSYAVENYRMRMDIFASSDPEWADPQGDLILEQAFVDATFDAGVVRIGRWRNTWLGWEGHHAPDMFRVRHSAAWDWNVQNHALKPNRPFLSDGLGLRTPDGAVMQAEVNIVDDVLGDGDSAGPADKAVGGAFRAQHTDIGMIELGWVYDPNSTTAGPGRDEDALGADLNGHYNGLRDAGWLFAAETQFHYHPDLTVAGRRYGNDLVLLGMAQYSLTEQTSCCLMIDWVERGFSASENEVLEYALSVTHRPYPRVRLDAEISYDDETADDADRFGVAVAATVQLP